MESEILKKFEDRILEKDIEGFLGEFQPLTEKFALLKLINYRYKNLRKDAFSFYRQSPPRTDNEILTDFIYARQAINERTQIRAYHELGLSLFGSHWQDERSDIARLKDFSSWIVMFRRKMMEKIFTEHTVEMVSHGVSPAVIKRATEELSHVYQQFNQQCDRLFQKTGFSCEKRFEQRVGEVKFSKYQLLFSLWEENLGRLSEWSQYVILSEEGQKTPAGQFVSIIEINDIPPEDIVPTFEGNYAITLLKKVISERPALGKFFGETHEKQIQVFRDLDKTIIAQNRLRILAKLGPGIPDIESESTPHSKLGILKAESKRKRGGKPIRQLMKNIGDVIQKITPCFMMGPLSVAKFLDPRVISFDVVIFDEASQVRPEDALGALLRGKQAVIIGDSHQLPPTTFFDKMIEENYDDTEENTESLSDMESILDLCVVSFGSKMLHWHYRSRHESLIALSNAEFYDNNLFVYPSPMRRSESLGLKFKHLPESVYDKGINRIEAQNVAKAVFDHYRKYPEKTLGVGTFSVRQQQAIEDEIERLRYQNPDLEKYFQDDQPEKFFVKNLETIQGDERDVIFISIGYGKDAAGKFAMQFGPLNRIGGERRLNVLITRARERCVVFSNFTSHELREKGLTGSGVRILKQFLGYAETGVIPCPFISKGDVESPFEDAVREFLTFKHFEVEKQIGCAGFRIDLAIVDPREPGRYLVGIECDGAQYHSSKVARDRDRLRQQILEKLGWKIIRVWSTDWYKDPVGAKRRLLEQIERCTLSPANVPKIQENPKPQNEIQPIRAPKKITQNPDPKKGNNGIREYQFCTSLYFNPDFMSVSSTIVADAIQKLVTTEGPIHTDEVLQRMKTICMIPRVTSAFRERVSRGCRDAANAGLIKIKGKFLWPNEISTPVLRQRPSNYEIDIERICDEEIGEAIDYVLRRQYATEPDELVMQTLKIFNYERAREKVRSRVYSVLQNKMNKNELELKNGMVDFKNKKIIDDDWI